MSGFDQKWNRVPYLDTVRSKIGLPFQRNGIVEQERNSVDRIGLVSGDSCQEIEK